jgi:ABC-type antimicrobial peptide transport system permease subunit
MPDRIRKVAMTIDPALRFVAIPTVKALLEQEAESERLGLFGIVMVALSVVLLSAAGIYALMSFTVTRRQREIGIRSALGAGGSRVLAGILSRALKQVGLGIAIGTVGAGACRASPAIPRSSANWLHLIEVAALMVLVGVIATIGPARRALRVSPTEALRSE